MNRRDFIISGATAAAALPILGHSFTPDSAWKNKVGLQLYSLRDIINANPRKILSEVASYGYKQLETYGYANGKLFGLTVKEYADHVKSLGMQTVSGHYGIDMVDKAWDKVCSDAVLMGQKYVVVPWMSKQYYGTMSDLKKTCETLNKGGETAKKYGLTMGYHNHDFEFGKVDGKTIMDVMLAELDPKLVSIELDLYWVVFAKQDPLQYFNAYPGRFEQWHVKDMDKTKRDQQADVGTGAIDFVKIFAQADKAGLKQFYIEQETYPVSPSQSVKNSIGNLLRLI
ncbi:MAG: sugar phosphate isomerase/epimerase family protein [Bacteroidota bacterium]